MCICPQKREAARLAEAAMEQKARGAFLLQELYRAKSLGSVDYAKTVLDEMRQLLADQDALDARISALIREFHAMKANREMPEELL